MKLPIIPIIVSIELLFDKGILKFNVSANTIDKKTLQEKKNDLNFIGEIYNV